MLTTILLLGAGVSILGTFVLSAWLLWLGARWAKIPDATFGRAAIAIVIMLIVGLAIEWIVLSDQEHYPTAAPLAAFLISLVASWKIVQWVLRTTFGRAILAWLPTLASGAIAMAIALGVVRPFLLEAFTSPTNAMAPTLLGEHLRAKCPLCGNVCCVAASQYEDSARRAEDPVGICGTCLRTSRVSVSDTTQFRPDRFLTLKVVAPRRWDVVVFQYPGDPSVFYAMRLVGLPGEEIAIRKGDLWIDGQRAEKPQEISALVYTGDPMTNPDADWGPVKLGAGEYLVLGDFSVTSADSRVWRDGAPGHPRYAVPEDHLVGVVSHIYWPPSRWRIFR